MKTRIVEKVIIGGKFSIKDNRTVIDFADRTSQFVSDKELKNAIKSATFGTDVALIDLIDSVAIWEEIYPEEGDTYIVDENSHLLVSGMTIDTVVTRKGKVITLKVKQFPLIGDIVPYAKYNEWRKFGALSIRLSAAARIKLEYKDDIRKLVLDKVKNDLGI